MKMIKVVGCLDCPNVKTFPKGYFCGNMQPSQGPIDLYVYKNRNDDSDNIHPDCPLENME